MSGITLLRGEELKMQLKPHMFSFFHLYLTFFLLLIWSYVIYDFFNSDKFSDFPFYDNIEALLQDSEVLAGAIVWSLGLFIVGFLARYFFMDSGGQANFRLYSFVALFGIIVMAYHGYSDMKDTMGFGRWFIPGMTAVVGLIGLFSVDFYNAIYLGIPLGLLTTNILYINQFPDANSDAKTGKNHLVVTLGKKIARWGYLIIV